MWPHLNRYSRWLRGRSSKAPPLFDPAWYVARNADVAAEGIDPWRHYVKHGVAEGRDPHPLFDTAWYLSRYPRTRGIGMDPLRHYCERGAALGHEPNALFDSAWYAQSNPDVSSAAFAPLLHYLQRGAAELRDPSPRFDTAWYLRSNPDVRPHKLTPLGDYLQYGHLEGRTVTPAGVQKQGRNTETCADRGRIAVYTAIVGDYDCLKLPTVIDPHCDYFCFTDRDISWQNVWIRRDLDWRHADATRTARYVKLHPHRYFADYEYSIWIDANLQLASTAQALMPASKEWSLASWSHPFRDCTYAEGEICVLDGKDDPAVIAAQMQRYRAAGLPERVGLIETSVLVRRHNAPEMRQFAQAWWDECARGSRRDQLSFIFAARQSNVRIAHLGPRGSSMRNDSRLRYFLHTRTRPHW